MASRPFKARFESMCPQCFLTIRYADSVCYVGNDVVHEKCAEKREQANQKAINDHKEREGYL